MLQDTHKKERVQKPRHQEDLRPRLYNFFHFLPKMKQACVCDCGLRVQCKHAVNNCAGGHVLRCLSRFAACAENKGLHACTCMNSKQLKIMLAAYTRNDCDAFDLLNRSPI